jgi:hypothetical protein
MTDIQVKVSDQIFPELNRLHKKMPAIHNFMISEIAEAFAEHEKKYLNGLMLNRVTGETYNSVKFFKLKRSHFRVRPGAGVNGRLNYLKIFQTGGEIRPVRKGSLAIDFGGGQVRLVKRVYIPPKPFVSVADETFSASGESDRIAWRVLDQYLKRRQL